METTTQVLIEFILYLSVLKRRLVENCVTKIAFSLGLAIFTRSCQSAESAFGSSSKGRSQRTLLFRIRIRRYSHVGSTSGPSYEQTPEDPFTNVSLILGRVTRSCKSGRTCKNVTADSGGPLKGDTDLQDLVHSPRSAPNTGGLKDLRDLVRIAKPF